MLDIGYSINLVLELKLFSRGGTAGNHHGALVQFFRTSGYWKQKQVAYHIGSYHVFVSCIFVFDPFTFPMTEVGDTDMSADVQEDDCPNERSTSCVMHYRYKLL